VPLSGNFNDAAKRETIKFCLELGVSVLETDLGHLQLLGRRFAPISGQVLEEGRVIPSACLRTIPTKSKRTCNP
jgi:hypothetical protein